MFGLYREGSSFAHRLDPRTKLIAVLAYLVATCVANSWASLALLAVAAWAMLRASRVKLAQGLRSIEPFAFLLAFVLLFDVLFVNRGEVLFQAGIVCVSTGGIAFGLQSVLRFACALVATSALMRVTSPTEASDGFLLLAGPLRHVGVRVDDAALVTGMALRFVSVLAQEYEVIRSAQEARLASSGGSWARRVRSLGPVIIPLFVRALRRSDQLALALCNRGYGAFETPRTSIRVYEMSYQDIIVIALYIALVIAACIV